MPKIIIIIFFLLFVLFLFLGPFWAIQDGFVPAAALIN